MLESPKIYLRQMRTRLWRKSHYTEILAYISLVFNEVGAVGIEPTTSVL